jgi:hypothetical protein
MGKVNNDLSDIIDLVTKTSSKYWNDFNITDIFNNIQVIIKSYKLYLNTLSLEQLGALAHILTATTLLFFIWSLVSIYFADYFLNYLKIEEKYPKLSKFMKIRRKFQNYYFILNSIIIFIGLIIIIYMNLLIFQT